MERPARSRLVALGVRGILSIAVVAATMTGCRNGDGDPRAASEISPPTAAPTTSATTNPLDQCTHQLQYWADEMLADFDDPGWDYQHMGLTSAKYDELRDIVDEAHAAEADGRFEASWLQDEVEAACQRILAETRPSTSDVGWP